ncbi:hypothetical protein [Pantoea vagans]|uniref:hypothetical protein n=1 Tax=Pantoea vagans TaxID=470934 RepID=UPI00164FD1CA
MGERDIYDLAYTVLSGLTDDWNTVFYNELGGELKIQWIQTPVYEAYASSDYSPGGVPDHCISISYSLLWQLYNDIKYYFIYLESGFDDEFLKFLWGDKAQLSELLTLATKEQAIQNIYMAAITWVYFHELGHLDQEHGVIRYNKSSHFSSTLVECDVQNKETMTGEKSALWHVTEIAADFYATTTCVTEIMRHFTDLKDARIAANYLVSAIAIVLHRFNGDNSFEEQSIPIGSHPKPFVRLELALPVIFERLSVPDSDERKQLINTGGRSAMSVSLYWLRVHTKFDGIPDHYFIEGMLTRPGVADYLKIIISKWDEIEPKVMSLNRFGKGWQILRFSTALRERLENNEFK